VTSIVGVLCSDGAVIGADGAVTLGPTPSAPTIEQPTEKISIIGHFIVAGTGDVGLNQRFCSVVERAWTTGILGKLSALEVGKHLAKHAIDDFSSTYAKMGSYGALVAFVCKDKPYICEFGVSNFQPELRDERLWHGSIGSAQPITDPFLALMRRAFWKGGYPKVADAVFAVTWALDHAIEVNPGGVNGPVRVALLSKDGAQWKPRILGDKDLAEHHQNVEGAYEALRAYGEKLRSGAGDGPTLPSVDPGK
jgi:hypothetical protein